MIGVIISFFLGIAVSVFAFFNLQKFNFFESKKEAIEYNDVITSQAEIARKFETENGFKFFGEKQNISSIKLTSFVYSPNQSCNIEFEVSSGIGKTNNGGTYYAKITASDVSSVASKIDCSKLAIEKVLPILLQGAFAGIIKAKIFEDGTIFKTFSQKEIIESKGNLYHDSGFLVENLNIGISSSSNKFEIYITDCKNTKCND
jgi:hypothetical protein